MHCMRVTAGVIFQINHSKKNTETAKTHRDCKNTETAERLELSWELFGGTKMTNTSSQTNLKYMQARISGNTHDKEKTKKSKTASQVIIVHNSHRYTGNT